MAQRRDKPSLQTSGQTWQVRLPDGSVRPLPGAAAPAPAAVCCFCGGDLGDESADRVLVSVRWPSETGEQSQAWSAHRGCVAERLHETVAGAGPFFDA